MVYHHSKLILDEGSIDLKLRLEQLEADNLYLRQQLTSVIHHNQEHQHYEGHCILPYPSQVESQKSDSNQFSLDESVKERSIVSRYCSDLDANEIKRYSRPILGGLGVRGQQELMKASVLVVGAGGIGSSCLLYLAGAGIGKIGIVDHDCVEVSNLHRQVIHTMNTVGQFKAESARKAIHALNPNVFCESIVTLLSHDNVMDIFSKFHVIVDASDNPKTRYLINDAAVLLKKPVVFASAVATEAQLTVFNTNNNDDDGGCYRCLYPSPSVSSSCASCADAGVLGTVPGVVGILQATEVIKLICGWAHPLSSHLVQYDAVSCCFFAVKKPSRQKLCPVCGISPTITSIEDSRQNLKESRGPLSRPMIPRDVTNTCRSVSCRCYQQIRKSRIPHVLLDVRVPIQFEICHLSSAVNIPLQSLKERISDVVHLVTCTVHGDERESIDSDKTTGSLSTFSPLPVYCICRRGIASAQATQLLTEQLSYMGVSVFDIEGGLTSWCHEVDPSYPMY